jgi:hypothetical protein
MSAPATREQTVSPLASPSFSQGTAMGSGMPQESTRNGLAPSVNVPSAMTPQKTFKQPKDINRQPGELPREWQNRLLNEYQMSYQYLKKNRGKISEAEFKFYVDRLIEIEKAMGKDYKKGKDKLGAINDPGLR